MSQCHKLDHEGELTFCFEMLFKLHFGLTKPQMTKAPSAALHSSNKFDTSKVYVAIDGMFIDKQLHTSESSIR